MSAAVSSGIGRYALDSAALYARERRVWGTPIGTHQGLAHPLARAKIDLELARLMAQKAAWCFDNGIEAGEAANMAKFAAAEAALAALDQAIQTHGGIGLASETGLADLWGLARLMRTAPVSREMILNFVAQHSLGLPEVILIGRSRRKRLRGLRPSNVQARAAGSRQSGFGSAKMLHPEREESDASADEISRARPDSQNERLVGFPRRWPPRVAPGEPCTRIAGP